MKLHYALLAGVCMAQLQAAENKQPTLEVELMLLKECPELAGECSKLWYETLGKKNHPDYEAIREAHTAFIASHAQDKEKVPVMVVALLNQKVIGMGALRATCYPRSGEVAWADENPKCTPWLAGFCVAEEHQKQGVGTQIAERLFKVALGLKYETVYLHSEDKTNQKIYKRNGAVKVAKVMREDKKNNRQVPGVVYMVDTLKALKKCINPRYEGIVE